MASQRRQIVVYPDRLKLLRYVLLYLIVGCVMVAASIMELGGAFAPYSQANPWERVSVTFWGTLAGVAALLLILLLLFTLYRVVVRKPSVIVNSDGIIDQCSLIVGGLGLIRWHEIENIILYAYRKNLKYVCVTTHDKRVPACPLTRLFQLSITLTLPKGTNMPQWLLSIPVSELAARIQGHYPAALIANKIDIHDLLHTSET